MPLRGSFCCKNLTVMEFHLRATLGVRQAFPRSREQRCPFTHKAVIVVPPASSPCFSSPKAQHRMPPQTKYPTGGGSSHNAFIWAELSGPGRTTWMRTGPWGLFQLAGRHGKQAAHTGTQYKDPEPVQATLTVLGGSH